MDESSGERSPDSLSPELQEILSRALDNYREGGLAAVEMMVDDLGAEDGAADSFADSAVAIRTETSDDPGVRRDVEGLVTEIQVGAIGTTSKHSFALWILERLREGERSGTLSSP